MTLRCILLGHRRSRSCASYDEKHARWISECKRCHVMMLREGDTWREFPAPPVGKLVAIERSQEKSAASGSGGETPFVAARAEDAADGGDAAAGERLEQTVELTAP